MKRIAILVILVALGGCSTAPKIKDYDEEARRKADDELAEYIKKHRQIVFMEGGWQVMAYCKSRTINKAVEKEVTLLCKPPKYAGTDISLTAGAFVVSKRVTTKPGHRAAWVVRFDNYTHHDICLNAQWRLMDIKAQDQLSEWQVMYADSKRQIGYMQQEVWDFGGKPVLLDFSGHVSGLLVRPVVDGSCFEKVEDEVRSDQ